MMIDDDDLGLLRPFSVNDERSKGGWIPRGVCAYVYSCPLNDTRTNGVMARMMTLNPGIGPTKIKYKDTLTLLDAHTTRDIHTKKNATGAPKL